MGRKIVEGEVQALVIGTARRTRDHLLPIGKERSRGGGVVVPLYGAAAQKLGLAHQVDAMGEAVKAVPRSPGAAWILQRDFLGDVGLRVFLGKPIEYGKVHLVSQKLVDESRRPGDHTIGIDVENGKVIMVQQEVHIVGLGVAQIVRSARTD